MHSSARFRANSPKGGDAKPPVYGTHVPMTAGLPVGFQTVPRMARGRAGPKARLQNAWVRHRHHCFLPRFSTGAKPPAALWAEPHTTGASQGRGPWPDVTAEAFCVPFPGSVSRLTFNLTLR